MQSVIGSDCRYHGKLGLTSMMGETGIYYKFDKQMEPRVSLKLMWIKIGPGFLKLTDSHFLEQHVRGLC